MSTPAQAVLELVVVLNRVGDRIVIWHVNVGQAVGLSRLSGAWVLGVERRDEVASLIDGYRVVGCGGGVVVPEGIRAAGTVDVDGTVEAVRRAVEAVDRKFSVHQEALANKLIRPQWPDIPHPGETSQPVREVDETVRPALVLARGIAELADAWAGFESLRVARPFLGELGGHAVRSLPLMVR